MRKPRDFDSELKALETKARQLKERKLQQLGELVIAAGADALPIEQLAGALIAAASEKDAAIKEGWRKGGANFFQRARRAQGGAASGGVAASPDRDPALPLDGGTRAR